MNRKEWQTQCCVCHRVRRGMRWQRGARHPDVPVTHGYCPSCLRAELARLDASELPLAVPA